MLFAQSKRLTCVPLRTTLLPPLQEIKTIISSMQIPRRIDDWGKPCFTPMLLVKQLDRPSKNRTCLETCSYKAQMAQIISSSTSKLLSISNNRSLGTLSKALQKSTKQHYNFLLRALVQSIKHLSLKIWSIVEKFHLKLAYSGA